MTVQEMINEVREALIALGYKKTKDLALQVKDDTRAIVILPVGRVIGIYDFKKHTFVD